MRIDEWSNKNLHVPPMLSDAISDNVDPLPAHDFQAKPENHFPPLKTHEQSVLGQPYVKYGNVLNDDGSYIEPKDFLDRFQIHMHQNRTQALQGMTEQEILEAEECVMHFRQEHGFSR